MSISVDGLTSSIASQYMTQASGTQNAELEESLKTDFSNAESEELLTACREFETYFTEQVFKSLKKMVPESEESSSGMGTMKDYFEDEMTKEYAKMSAEGEGLGLAQMLFEQMKRNYNIEDQTENQSVDPTNMNNNIT